MAKLALLIGVSEYQESLRPLPSAVKDVEEMQRILERPEIGGFDNVQALTNPEDSLFRESIDTLFSDRSRDDVILLFFSGHGVKDDSGKLYFATSRTRKTQAGTLLKSTAVSANFVQDIMSTSRCKRQVIILDCCFSGAFAEGMTAKADNSVDVQAQLGGKGRAVLTSSTSTQYSFEQDNAELSIYTRYIVEGIETGAADINGDGQISIDELHEYASQKVKDTAPAMQPKIYSVEEGFRICLAKAPLGDPRLIYRQEVEQSIQDAEISVIGRRTLDRLQQKLKISTEDALTIETQALKPHRDHRNRVEEYTEALKEAMLREQPLSEQTRAALKRFQEVLGLDDSDIHTIKGSLSQSTVKKIISPVEGFVSNFVSTVGAPSPPVSKQHSREDVYQPESTQDIKKTKPEREDLEKNTGIKNDRVNGLSCPPTRMFSSIVWTIVFFPTIFAGGIGLPAFFIGLAAIYFSRKVKNKYLAGDLEGAVRASNMAGLLCRILLIVFVIIVLIVVVALLINMAQAPYY